jgi:protoporphyrinogen/coproporphyrinogen III oxidase
VTPHVAVVGGGISGLAAAHRLRVLLGPSARITVVEGRFRLGGVLRTTEVAGVPMDVGAEAFLARRPEVPALLAELGLSAEVVHPGTAPATVRAGGRTARLPARTMLGVPGHDAVLDGLLSPDGVARARAERTRPLDWTAGADRSLGALLRERFGDELADRLVDPLLGGVYAGRVDGLGLRATIPTLAAALDSGAPSLTAAADTLLPPARPEDPTHPRESGKIPGRVGDSTSPGPGPAPVFGALRGGYRVLLDALCEASGAELRTGLPVRALTGTGTRWRLELGAASTGGPRPATDVLDADAVVLAVPAPALRRLLDGVAPRASAAAARVELASPVVIALAYRAGDAAALPETSGLLVAADEPLRVKAFTHSSRKWPHLAAARTDGLIRLRASVGRAGEAARLRVPDRELAEWARADLAELTGITAEPVDVVVQRWGGGLPQYGVGHADTVAALERAVAEVPGLAVAGALLHGVGVPACIGTGRSAAERIAAGLGGAVQEGGTAHRAPDRGAPGGSGSMAV